MPLAGWPQHRADFPHVTPKLRQFDFEGEQAFCGCWQLT
jgi:hypothetical protein